MEDWGWETVSIWSQPWVKDPSDPFIRFSCQPGFENMKVHELIAEEMGTWDEDQMSYFFILSDRAQVLKTTLPLRGTIDRHICCYDRSYKYTMKMGYNRAATLAMNYDLEVEGRWNLL